ncbi:MAG: hypothetical protein ACI8WB_003657 [Phenylobacterium sp.]|jgi:uncharacterized protein YciI
MDKMRALNCYKNSTISENLMSYFAQCFIDPNKMTMLKQLRDQHLAYIKTVKDSIAYGGVCGTDEIPYQSICLFLNVNTQSEVENFIANDPFNSVYSNIEIKPFVQRIPAVES